MVHAIQAKKEMIMNKTLKKIVWLVIAIPPAYLAAVWNQFPENIALHFNIQGVPDRYGSKNELLGISLLLTVINIGVYLLLTNVHRIDPRKYAAENKPRMQRIAFVIAVFVSATFCIIIYSGLHADMKWGPRLILAGVGLLFCFIGNYLHTIRPNYFAGLRLPWTLENEDNWRKTHLLAGKLFFAGGLLIAVICLLVPVLVAFIAFFIIILIITVIPGVYSYRLYKQQKNLPQ
jgi:uncharacterized membrane protein